MTFLRIDPDGKKHYSMGNKRTRMFLEFERLCMEFALTEATCDPNSSEYLDAKRRYERKRQQITYSIGKLEHKAYASKRAAHRIKNDLVRLRKEIEGEVNGTAVN